MFTRTLHKHHTHHLLRYFRSHSCLQFAYCGTKTGEVLKFRIDRDDIQSFNTPDRIRPTLQDYSRDRFGKGCKSIACVLNPSTGNTNILCGGGDGTVQIMNSLLNSVKKFSAKLTGAVTSMCISPSGQGFYCGTSLSQRYYLDFATFTPELRGTCHYGEIFDVKVRSGAIYERRDL